MRPLRRFNPCQPLLSGSLRVIDNLRRNLSQLRYPVEAFRISPSDHIFRLYIASANDGHEIGHAGHPFALLVVPRGSQTEDWSDSADTRFIISRNVLRQNRSSSELNRDTSSRTGIGQHHANDEKVENIPRPEVTAPLISLVKSHSSSHCGPAAVRQAASPPDSNAATREK